jgi:hypothetical protein
MTLASGAVGAAMERTAAQLIDRPSYIRSVLEPPRPAGEGLARGGYPAEGGDAAAGGERAGPAPGPYSPDAAADGGPFDGPGESAPAEGGR